MEPAKHQITIHEPLLRTSLSRLFNDHDDAFLDDLLEAVEWRCLVGGTVLYSQGEPAVDLAFVVSGRFEISVATADGESESAGEVVRGESIGEIALMTGQKRSATVTAARDSVVALLSKQRFDELALRFPGMTQGLSRRIILRLTTRERRELPRRRVHTIALVAHDAMVDLGAVAQRLELALLRHGRVTRLQRQRLSALLGRTDDDSDSILEGIEVSELLDRIEAGHDFVILEGENRPSAWTLRCLRQADRVLVVARASASPQLGEIEQAIESGSLPRPRAGFDLVLLHPDSTRPPHGTLSWLEPRQVDNHHHLAWVGDASFERLARHLADRAVGLVLGGGGARGFAHLGAIRAIREAGIPIDAVGGTSIGAIIGSLVALGWPDERILEVCWAGFVNDRPINDFTIPILSLVKGAKLRRTLGRFLGGRRIEDLWLPFFAVSCNLSRARVHLHDRGPLWRALRASASLPGILPPAVAGGELLVDGGIINNLPIDIMDRRKRGPNIAVDLGVGAEYTVQSESMPTAFEYLVSRLLPWLVRVEAPTLTTVILKVATLGSQASSRENSGALHLNPPLAGFDLLDWGRIHRLVDVGYEHTRQALSEWSGVDELQHRPSRFDSSGISLRSLSFGRQLSESNLQSVTMHGT